MAKKVDKAGGGVQDYTLTREPTSQIMLEAINALRQNPKKYEAVRKALKAAKSDEERVKQLMHFATSERELAALLPARLAGAQAAAWTTITVTTVFILEDTAY
jgi:hypothetical protein